MIIPRESALLISGVITVIYAAVLLIKKTKPKKLIFKTLFLAYIFLVISYCFFPIFIHTSAYEVPNNFIPFKSIANSLSESFSEHTVHGIKSVVGNFLMLMPLGVFYHYLIDSFKKKALFILLFSVSIEAVQFIIGLIIGFNYRCVDIDDVILNTLGGILAAAIYDFIIKRIKINKQKP